MRIEIVCTVQEKEEEKLREEFAKQGINIPIKDKSDVFDSNTITPGTPFMHRLSIALQYYIHCRLNSDPGWKGITVRLTSVAYCQMRVSLLICHNTACFAACVDKWWKPMASACAVQQPLHGASCRSLCMIKRLSQRHLHG